ncbi:acid-resistant locus arl7 [hydrocarbon metagenome]|uniref:Acid-resistant locus arl7 n=1 Tax=hydrocarbon metagenome TaxID=938273 RepID=A0A0W8F1P2_9ZZZZ
MKHHSLLAKNINVEFDRQQGFGGRLSDRIADYSGGWPFIIVFIGLMILWVVVNTSLMVTSPIDPYPYHLLDLILSAIAAILAPIIIMSQKRLELRDRLNAENDYRINRNTEMEIHQLHKKIDHLLFNQGQRMLEIQKIQVELMDNLIRKTP